MRIDNKMGTSKIISKRQWHLEFSNCQGKRRLVREIDSKNVMFDEATERTFGSSYQELRKSDGYRSRDSTEFLGIPI